MRGNNGVAGSLFSYVDLEKRIRMDHPLRVIRGIVNTTLRGLSSQFDPLYSPFGWESIPPDRLSPVPWVSEYLMCAYPQCYGPPDIVD